MLLAAVLALFVFALPQDPVRRAAEEEEQARSELRQAAQDIDALLLHAKKASDQAVQALARTKVSEQKATQADRARLAKLAADLTAELDALQQQLTTRSQALRELRLKIDSEVLHEKGSVPWFKDQVQAARKLATPADTRKELRRIEEELAGKEAGAKPGAKALLGLVRFHLAEAIREDADAALEKKRQQEAVSLLRDASKKLGEVLAGPDAADTGVGSSLLAATLHRKVVIETRLFVAFDNLARQQASDRSTANGHRDNAAEAFRRLERSHAEATAPDGQRFVDLARAESQRLQGTR